MENFIKDWEFLFDNAVSRVLPKLPKFYITFTKSFNWNIINRRKTQTKYNQRH